MLALSRTSLNCLLLRGLLSSAVICAVPSAKATQQTNRDARRSELRQAHQSVVDALNEKGTEGRYMTLDDPRVPSLIREGWRLAGLWAVDFLNDHPEPSESDLKLLFSGFFAEPAQPKTPDEASYEDVGYSFTGYATRIADSVFVIEARYCAADFPTGTFMVLARGENGHFQVLWSIKDLAEKHYPQRDEIGRWMHLTRRAYYSGPLTVEQILPLPASSIGRARFLVKAVQNADGGTILYQLSFWEWTGTEALPLLTDTYLQAGDTGNVQLEHSVLHIETKENLKTLLSCGSCEEPKGFWEITIDPTGVKDLGHHLLQPEYLWVDDLLTRIQNNESTATLANHKVENDIRAHIAESQTQLNRLAALGDHSRFSWGMISKGCEVLQRGRRGRFRISTDEATLTFEYLLRRGKPFFTSVQIRPS